MESFFDFTAFSDIVFRYPLRLWFALPAVAVLTLLVFLKYGKARAALRDRWVAMHLDGSNVASFRSHFLFFLVVSLAAALLVAAWAFPERRQITHEPVYGNTRFAFLLDVSNSMEFAHDIPPNRLEAAKAVIEEFIHELWSDQELKGHYSLALIPFAQSAIPLYMPFTANRSEFLYALRSVNSRTVTSQGTSLFFALLAYNMLLERRPATGKEMLDIAVLISDGGKGEGIRSELNDIELVKNSLPRNVMLVTVGVGSVERISRGKGVPPEERVKAVPLAEIDKDGNFVRYLRKNPKDPQSPILYSELDQEMLQIVAGQDGRYYFFKDREVMLRNFKDILRSYRIQTGTTDRIHYESAVQWFLAPAFFLFSFAAGFLSWARTLFERGRMFLEKAVFRR